MNVCVYYKYKYTYMCVYYICTYIHNCIHTFIHTHRHTYIHTCIHTYSTHAATRASPCPSGAAGPKRPQRFLFDHCETLETSIIEPLESQMPGLKQAMNSYQDLCEP